MSGTIFFVAMAIGGALLSFAVETTSTRKKFETLVRLLQVPPVICGMALELAAFAAILVWMNITHSPIAVMTAFLATAVVAETLFPGQVNFGD